MFSCKYGLPSNVDKELLGISKKLQSEAILVTFDEDEYAEFSEEANEAFDLLAEMIVNQPKPPLKYNIGSWIITLFSSPLIQISQLFSCILAFNFDDWTAEGVVEALAGHSIANRRLLGYAALIARDAIAQVFGKRFNLSDKDTIDKAVPIVESLAEQIFWPKKFNLELTTYENEADVLLHLIRNNL